MKIDKETKKLDYNNFEEAKELFLRFRDKYLHGNINELTNFSFWEIENTEFDASGNDFDGDRTRIVYAIDYLLYHDSGIPDFSIDDNYSGDTINTFRTLFGNNKTGTDKKVEEKFKLTSSEIASRNDFFRTYQKIGNFYLLPNGKNEEGKSLNTYRGTDNDYRDFFDIFLSNLNLCLKGYKKDETLNYLIFKTKNGKNVDFFESFSSCEKFCDIFFMTDYLTLDFNHPKTNNNRKCNYMAFYSLGINEDTYKKFAFGYIAKATELIDRRSLKLVEVLKTKYPELAK